MEGGTLVTCSRCGWDMLNPGCYVCGSERYEEKAEHPDEDQPEEVTEE